MIGIGLLMAAAGLCGLFIIGRSPVLILNEGKPFGEPRWLRYFDSWQTVIFDAQADAEVVRGRLMDLFRGLKERQSTVSTEKIWYWGIDGKIEREQIVLRNSRGIVYCQVYAFGTDLYVGWDAHLNTGTWVESDVASGIDRKTGKRVKLRAVTHAQQPTTEYDLVDLNCLLEWTHAQVTRVVKQYAKEREIDQEIDFTIIRGDRQNVSANNNGSAKSTVKRGFLRRKA